MSFKKTSLRPEPSITQKSSTKSRSHSWLLSGSFSALILSLFSVVTLTFLWIWFLARGFSLEIPFASLDILWWSGVSTPAEKQNINILLVGIGWEGHEWNDLTDTMMLASINQEKNSISFLSVPRDLYVEYPTGGAGKINEVYPLSKKLYGPEGGMRMLSDKFTEITGEKIHHFFVVDFRAFVETVDLLGGIDIDVPEDLTDTAYPDNNWGYQTFRVKKGLQTMNGSTALKYARSRHSTSDFDRSRRQQLVIGAIKEKLLSPETLLDPDTLQELYDWVKARVVTDMGFAELLSLALLVKDIPRERMISFQLSDACIQWSYQCSTWALLYTPARDLFAGASVLLPDTATATIPDRYDRIQLFAYLLTHFPDLYIDSHPVYIVTHPRFLSVAKQYYTALAALGFTFADTTPILSKNTVSATGSTTISYVWDSVNGYGVSSWSDTLKAIEKITLLTATWLTRPAYIDTPEPIIELVVWKDAPLYLPFR